MAGLPAGSTRDHSPLEAEPPYPIQHSLRRAFRDLRAAVSTTSNGMLQTIAEEACSIGSLNGRFIFTGRGFIEAVEPGIQRVHYGMFVFDGAGKFTGKQSSSRGGKIGRETLQGTYTLDSDCTGAPSKNTDSPTIPTGCVSFDFGSLNYVLRCTIDPNGPVVEPLARACAGRRACYSPKTKKQDQSLK